MRINAAIWVSPLVLTVLAGCLTGDGEGYHVWATEGRFALGFAYDGKGVDMFAGPAFIDAKEAANTGVFVTQGKVGGTDYRIVFEDFKEAAGKKFQDGGIAADFHEHGASGVGDRSIPEVDLEMSAWGLATLFTGGKKYPDPVSGKDQWSAHYMVIRNGVRNDTNNAIHTKDHKVYAPDMAADGLSTPGDYELHLVLRNQTGNASGAASFGPFPASAPTPSTTYNQDHKFTVGALTSTVVVDISVSGTGATASNATFTIRWPSGTEVVKRMVGPGGMQPVSPSTSSAQLRFTAKEAGEYTINVAGRIAPGGTYSVRGTITPPPSVVLNFWWENLMFGMEAEEKADKSGMLEGTKYHGIHEHAESGTMAADARRHR